MTISQTRGLGMSNIFNLTFIAMNVYTHFPENSCVNY